MEGTGGIGSGYDPSTMVYYPYERLHMQISR